MKRKCASCHRTFFTTEDTDCFQTCGLCRRPDHSQQEHVVFDTGEKSRDSRWSDRSNTAMNIVENY
jgi:hypothetical protein